MEQVKIAESHLIPSFCQKYTIFHDIILHNMIPYHVYIVECADKTLYTGITADIQKRLDAHNSKKSGAKYTKSRRPVVLRFTEACMNKSEALQLESKIKNMDKSKKMKLIEEQTLGKNL